MMHRNMRAVGERPPASIRPNPRLWRHSNARPVSRTSSSLLSHRNRKSMICRARLTPMTAI